MTTRTIAINASPALTEIHPHMLSLLNAVDSFRGVVPLLSVSCMLQPDNRHLFEITASDGRVWRQHLRIYDTTAPQCGMTFEHTDEWDITEFVLQRPVRDILILLIRNFGLIDFTVTFA